MDIEWTTFTRRTNDPKLAYLERLLDRMGIPHRRRGFSWHAPITEVPKNRLEEAWDVLETLIGGATLDDIPDDHSMFKPSADPA